MQRLNPNNNVMQKKIYYFETQEQPLCFQTLKLYYFEAIIILKIYILKV